MHQFPTAIVVDKKGDVEIVLLLSEAYLIQA